MDKTRVRQTDLFEVRSKTGRVYEITEQTMQIMTTFLDNSNTGWLDGKKRYLVKSGGSANMLSDSEFYMVSSGENASRVRP